ncbi:glycosyltransferase [Pseudoroseomonas globiformis]|uniref:Glycosyltransferase n=1 Tax=Teichococcus globiformis TaxID=2307229 RepID=A0ABV7G067_9PROT
MIDSAGLGGRAPLVCMLSAAHPPADVRVVAKEGAALAEAGWRVMHLCPQGTTPAPTAHAGVSICTYRRGGGWRGRVANIPVLARRAAESGAAVLHASEPDAWLAAILAARRTGARVVLDVHEHYPSRLDNRLPAPLRPLGRTLIRAACRAMSRHADAVVVAKDGLDGDFADPLRITPVRNYATPAKVSPRRHAPGPLTLVHLGALGRTRGSVEMLEALALCPPGTRLDLVGRFTDGSEDAFRAHAAVLGLSRAVTRPGWMPHEAALARAATADIGLVLFQPGIENHRLALPHKLFDCMLAGLPVIAPAFAEEVAAVIREAGCGILVDTADPAAVASAVCRLADPVLRAELGAAGRAAALGRFGWAAEAARLVALYRRLAPLPPARGIVSHTTAEALPA